MAICRMKELGNTVLRLKDHLNQRLRITNGHLEHIQYQCMHDNYSPESIYSSLELIYLSEIVNVLLGERRIMLLEYQYHKEGD